MTIARQRHWLLRGGRMRWWAISGNRYHQQFAGEQNRL